jgi:hypothetical protein
MTVLYIPIDEFSVTAMASHDDHFTIEAVKQQWIWIAFAP